MKSYAVQRPKTAFSRSKAPRQRSPRHKLDGHLNWIATLPCTICGKEGGTHAAHIRMSSAQHGKRAVGAAEKPDDCWTLPLCAAHHLFGLDAQHSLSEAAFWEHHGRDPLVIALALWRVSGDEETARLIFTEAAPAQASPECRPAP